MFYSAQTQFFLLKIQFLELITSYSLHRFHLLPIFLPFFHRYLKDYHFNLFRLYKVLFFNCSLLFFTFCYSTFLFLRVQLRLNFMCKYSSQVLHLKQSFFIQMTCMCSIQQFIPLFTSYFHKYSYISFKFNLLIATISILFIHLILLLTPIYMGGESFSYLF